MDADLAIFDCQVINESFLLMELSTWIFDYQAHGIRELVVHCPCGKLHTLAPDELVAEAEALGCSTLRVLAKQSEEKQLAWLEAGVEIIALACRPLTPTEEKAASDLDDTLGPEPKLPLVARRVARDWARSALGDGNLMRVLHAWEDSRT